METTFYEDSARYRIVPRGEEVRGTKRPATLDLDSAARGGKKSRGNALLTSPDLHMLKLESPELEKLIIQQHGIQQQCMYPKGGGDYSRDFPDALSQQPPASGFGGGGHLYQPLPPQQSIQPDALMAPPPTSMVDVSSYGYNHHQQQQQQPCSNAMSSYAPYYCGGGMDAALVVSVKEEPQTVPCASPHDPPPRSPIDMEDQERLKLERKRLRNRIAASKCRRRKLERIARLEDKVSHLKNENAELSEHVTRLKEHVCQLKQQVMEHVRSGCEILVAPYPQYAEDL